MWNFLSNYATLFGNTYYPGHSYQNIHYIAGTRVYFCTTITNHLLKHIYKLGRFLCIRYDNQPQNQYQETQEEEITTQQQTLQHETQSQPTTIQQIPENDIPNVDSQPTTNSTT